jgi:probable addiction module antidote protein
MESQGSPGSDPEKMFGDNELAIATYLTEAFPTEDFAKVLSALKTAIRAQNVQDLAKDAGLRRERLYHTFNGGVDPQLSRVMKLFKALNVRLSTQLSRLRGGEGGIRTPDRLAPMPHFECGAFNHSATSPKAPNWGRAPAVGAVF